MRLMRRETVTMSVEKVKRVIHHIRVFRNSCYWSARRGLKKFPKVRQTYAMWRLHRLDWYVLHEMPYRPPAEFEYIYQERAYDTSSNELPSFSLVNYSFNYKINNNFKSNFKISNILDQDYEVNRNYNTPGISFFGGIESEF